MAAATIAQPNNELVDIAKIFGQFAPLLVGKQTNQSGTTTDTSTQQVGPIDPALAAQQDQLFQTLMARATNSSQADALVEDIMHRAAVAFAPVLGQEKSAGVYNSTTKDLLGKEAMARATGAAAASVLEMQTQAFQQAAAVQNSRVQAAVAQAPKTTTSSKSSAESSKTPAPISGKNAVASIASLAGGAYSLGKLYDQMTGKKKKLPNTPPGTSPGDAGFDASQMTTDPFAFDESLLGESTGAPAANVGSFPGGTGGSAMDSSLTEPFSVADANVLAPDTLFELSSFAKYDPSLGLSNASFAPTGLTEEESLAGGMNLPDEATAGIGGAAGGFEAAGGNQAADSVINGILGADAAGATFASSGGAGAADSIIADILGADFAGAPAAGAAAAGAGGFAAAGGEAAADTIIGGILGEGGAGAAAGFGALGPAAALLPIAMTLFSGDFVNDTSDQYEYLGPATVKGSIDRSSGFTGTATRQYRHKQSGQVFTEDFSDQLSNLAFNGLPSGSLNLDYTADDLPGVIQGARDAITNSLPDNPDEDLSRGVFDTLYPNQGTDGSGD